MSMNSFELHNPASVAEAIALLDPQDANNRRIRIMAGGQDLLTEMKDRLVEPEAVVNLKHIPGLDKLTWDAKNGLQIGALVKVADVADNAEVKKRFPALAMAAGSIASPQIRHMGTMGGNLCQRPRCWYYRNENILCVKKGGDRCYAIAGENKYNAILGGGPSYIVHPSDSATALVALGATVTIAGPKGSRDLRCTRPNRPELAPVGTLTAKLFLVGKCGAGSLCALALTVSLQARGMVKKEGQE